MIRWITETLGTCGGDRDSVPAGAVSVDVRDLVDKGGNAAAAVRERIDRAVDALRAKKTVVVHCDYGISRSNSVAAGALALFEGISFSDAVRRVVAATGETSIKIDVLATVRQAIAPNPAGGPPAGRRILVTGGSGFVGAALLPLLPGLVVAPASREIDLLRDVVLLDLVAREHAVDTVIHLATPRIYTTNDSLGVALTHLKNVLDVCRANDATLVYVSSWEIYSGYRSSALIADESLPALPGGTYGQTKLLCETLIEQHRRRYGLRCLLLRSSPVYGAASDRPRFIRNFLAKARRGEAIVTHRYRNGPPALDLLHVDDLRRAVGVAVERRIEGVLHVGTGRLTSTAEVASIVCRAVGSTSTIGVAKIDEEVGNIAMDAGRAHRLLDWRPAISVEDGLAELIARSAGDAPGRTTD